MRTFAQKPKATQQTKSAKSTHPDRMFSGQSRDIDSILHLQRTIGNHAVQRLLQSNPEELNTGWTGTAAPGFGHDFSRIPVSPPTVGAIQTKLAVNMPGDEYELEADRVAEQVMRMPGPKLRRTCACGGGCPRCQMDEHRRLETKHVDSTESGQTVAPPIVEEALANGGGSLPDGLRADMEQRFGHEFGLVRLHTHARATESAAAVGARAYTVGRDVVFAAGEYAPDTDAGRRLIAHELAHVVQQDAARAPNGRAGITIGAVDDSLEREAETGARRANEDTGPSIASAPLSAGVSRVERAPMLQRDNGPGEKKEEIPIERVPYREKAPPATGETEPEEAEAEKGPTLTLASAARPTCDPTGLARKDYLAQPNTSTDDFGLTRFAGTVSMALTTRKLKGGLMLEPLKVALPAITSVYTKADTFIEETAVVLSQEGARAECPGGKVPLQWRIFSPGAAKIREAEMEHCEDLQYAYDVTLGWYAQVVDGLIAKGRTFRNEAAAFKRLEKLTGTHPTNWLPVFECLTKKTEKRDGRKFTNAWHMPRVKPQPPRLEDGCKFSRVFVTGAANFPELGKHPAPDVIKGCGESPNAVKSLVAGAAAAKASVVGEGGEGQQEGKPREPTPKTPEPSPKSTEPGR